MDFVWKTWDQYYTSWDDATLKEKLPILQIFVYFEFW